MYNTVAVNKQRSNLIGRENEMQLNALKMYLVEKSDNKFGEFTAQYARKNNNTMNDTSKTQYWRENIFNFNFSKSRIINWKFTSQKLMKIISGRKNSERYR